MATRNVNDIGNINDKCKIKVCKNGPYLVSGGIPLIKMIIGTDNEGTLLSGR